MRVAARGQQIRGNVTDPSHVRDHVDGFLHVGQVGKELRLGVALDDVGGNRMTRFVCSGQTVRVRFVEEHLRFQDRSRFQGNGLVLAERQVEQHLNGGATLHVRKLFEGRRPVNFSHLGLSQNEVLQECRLGTCCACRAGQDVVDEEIQRRFTLRVVGDFDLVNDLGQQGRVVDRFGVQSFGFAVFDFLEIRMVFAHLLRLE